MKNSFYLALVCFIFLNETTAQNKKIGLVLSGGGAKGLAHIGILKAIDKAGLKIDFITGTSMGAVVGGLYAIGYSADTLEKIALSENWDILLSNATSLNKISIEEKSEYEKYATEFVIDKGKLVIPTGLIEGEELSLELRRLFLPVYNQRNFKRFSIPFACVATDLLTGKPIILDTGNVVEAVRASMAIPTIFTPVKTEKKLLVDGGLVYNLPAEICRNMGADYIIGVDVGEPMKTKKEIKTLVDVINQVMSISDLKNHEYQKSKCDLLIMPDLKGFGGGDFNKVDTIIRIGKAEGKNYLETFEKIKNENDAIQKSSNRLPKTKYDTLNISSVEIIGNSRTSKSLIEYHLDTKNKKFITPFQFNENIKDLYGTRYYNSIKYDIRVVNKKTTKINLYVEEIPAAKVRLALNYYTFLGPSAIVGLNFKNRFWSGSRFLAKVNIGESPRVKLIHSQFLNKKHRSFFNILGNLEQYNFPIYFYNELNTIYRQNYLNAGLSMNFLVTNYSQFGFGALAEYHTLNYNIGSTLLFRSARYSNIQLFADLNYDKKNTQYFTTKGIEFSASNRIFIFGRYTKIEDFGSNIQGLIVNDGSFLSGTQIEYKYAQYFELSKRLSLNFRLNGGFTFSVKEQFFKYYSVGGINETYRNNLVFYGLKDYQLYRPNVQIAALALQYELRKKLYLSYFLNGVASTSLSNIDLLKLNADNLNFGQGVQIGYNSFLGPLQVALMHRDYNSIRDISFYVNLGFNF